jgi:hypothetical protein
MNYLRIHILIIIFAMIATNFAESSLLSNLKTRIGVHGGVNSNSHKADFLMLPDVPNCCVEYGNATSTKYGFRVFAEINVLSFIDIQIGASYNELGANLQSDEYIGNTEVLDQVFPVFTTHNLEADIGVLAINPSISIMPYKDIPIRLGVGFETGILLQKYIYQHEDLSKEAIENGVIFYDGVNDVGTSRNVYKGDIPYTNNYNAITFSAAYDIPISSRFSLRPEVIYKYCLDDIAPSVNWKISNLTFGLSICYNLYPDAFDMKYLMNSNLTDSVPDNLAKNQRIINNELESSIAFFQNQAQNIRKDDKDDDLLFRDRDRDNGFSCCYIIFYSSRNKEESNSILKIMKDKFPNSNIYIQEWMNPDSEQIYFRVRTKCYDDYFKAFEFEKQYKEYKMGIDQPSIIKCY